MRLERNRKSGNGCAMRHGMLRTRGRYELLLDALDKLAPAESDLLRRAMGRGKQLGSERTSSRPRWPTKCACFWIR